MTLQKLKIKDHHQDCLIATKCNPYGDTVTGMHIIVMVMIEQLPIWIDRITSLRPNHRKIKEMPMASNLRKDNLPLQGRTVQRQSTIQIWGPILQALRTILLQHRLRDTILQRALRKIHQYKFIDPLNQDLHFLLQDLNIYSTQSLATRRHTVPCPARKLLHLPITCTRTNTHIRR